MIEFDEKPAIKKAVIEMSQRFESRYGHYWIASNEVDDRENLREKILQWVDEFYKANISAESITKITDVILEKAEFSSYPPSLNRFIYICNEMNKMFSSGENGQVYLSIKRLDERFTFTYGRLWAESDKDKSRRRLEFWSQEILNENIHHKIINKVLKKVRSKGAYTQYPPTLNQFILECLFEKIDDDFLDTDLAFMMACNHENNVHHVIRKVRQIIGSYTLRASKDKKLQSLFEKIYLAECHRYVSDPDKYLKDALLEGVKQEAEVCEQVAKNNLDFFTSIKNNTH